ncbi:MAG: hypothetical protein ACRCW9_03965 [Cetobacterium sp.]
MAWGKIEYFETVFSEDELLDILILKAVNHASQKHGRQFKDHTEYNNALYEEVQEYMEDLSKKDYRHAIKEILDTIAVLEKMKRGFYRDQNL